MLASRSASSLIVLLLVASVGVGAPRSVHAQDEPSSFSHRMAQGRFFLEQGLLRQALDEFEAAALLPDGAKDVAVHQLIARTRYQFGDLAGAVESARTAAALDARMPPEFAEFHEFLTTRFGKVLIIGARMDGATRPEAVSALLDPEIKRAFESAMKRLDSGGTGSTSVYLPVGSYRVAGHIIEVTASTATRMDLRPTVGVGGTGGVYGERRGGAGQKRKPRSSSKKPPSSADVAPRASAPRRASGPLDVGPALDLRIGGMGYGQQGSGSGGGRLGVGGELVLGHRVGLRGHLQAGAWRAERLQLLSDDPLATGAPPAVLVEGGLSVSVLATIASGILVGPEVGWTIGGSRPLTPLLPAGYLGPAQYVMHGPEVGLRTVFGNATMAARPQVAVKAFVREHAPIGAVLPADARPHLTAGVVIAAGVRVR